MDPDTETYESPITVAIEQALAHLLGAHQDSTLHLTHVRQTLIALHQAEQRREKVRRHRARAKAQNGAPVHHHERAA